MIQLEDFVAELKIKIDLTLTTLGLRPSLPQIDRRPY